MFKCSLHIHGRRSPGMRVPVRFGALGLSGAPKPGGTPVGRTQHPLPVPVPAWRGRILPPSPPIFPI